MGFPATLGADCAYLGRSAVSLGRCVSRSRHGTARRRVRSRSVDPSGSTLRRSWVSWSVGPLVRAATEVGVSVRGPLVHAATKVGVLARHDEGGCLGPWSAWSAATKVGVLVRPRNHSPSNGGCTGTRNRSTVGSSSCRDKPRCPWSCCRTVMARVSNLRTLVRPTYLRRDCRGLGIHDFAARREIDKKGAVVAG
jgi:hypothetical protein